MTQSGAVRIFGHSPRELLRNNRLLWALVMGFLGVSFLFSSFIHSSVFLLTLAVAFIPSAIGLWHRIPWSRYAAAACLIFLAVYFITTRSLTPGNVLISGLLVYGVLETWRTWSRETRNQTPLSLVFLLDKPLSINMTAMARNLSRLLGHNIQKIQHPEPNQTDYLTGSDYPYSLRIARRSFSISVVKGNYFTEARQLAESVSDLRFREAIQDHKAWIEVMFTADPSIESDPSHCYRILSNVALAALSSTQHIKAVMAPRKTLFRAMQGARFEDLLLPDPLNFFDASDEPSVMAINSTDEQLTLARSQARDHWSQFLSAYEDRQPNITFSVKVPLEKDDSEEHIWLDLVNLSDELLTGRVANEPLHLTHLKIGDELMAPTSAVEDWMILYPDGKVQGAFLARQMEKVQG